MILCWRQTATRNGRTLMALCVFSLAVAPICVLAADNVPPPGFVALFNGENLDGWKGLVESPPKRQTMNPEQLQEAQAAADKRMHEHWRVVGGVLIFDGQGDSLTTERDYGDFELLCDWKILAGGDSGIYLRGSPQVQIWDRAAGSGGLYNNQTNPSKPLTNADRPVGEWNRFRILMVRDRVTVYLNDVLVVDNVVMENYWERDKPIYTRGQIELQNHGNALFFKNVFVRDLHFTEAASEATPPSRFLRWGDHVAVVGDSITEQKRYSRYIEDYLLMCQSHLKLRVMQHGWSGERAPGFEARLENDLLPFAPTVVTTCYGMNDGRYRAYEPHIGQAYAKSMNNIVRRLHREGIRVVVGSPGAVDTYSFTRLDPVVYNVNLSYLRDIARGLAESVGAPFANVHDSMIVAMRKAKTVLGETYDVCGADGFHPQENGHIVMAYAFLKALGVDGEIGTIDVDRSGKTTATVGHQISRSDGNTIEVVSRRYPFCFFGDEKDPTATRSILPFLPFQSDFNRFVLKVRNLTKDKATVTWGSHSRTFSKEELETGVNLAAEFLDNPFCEAFAEVDTAVARKQAVETRMIKRAVTHLREARSLLGGYDDGGETVAAFRQRFVAHEAILQAEVRDLVRPVEHVIQIAE